MIKNRLYYRVILVFGIMLAFSFITCSEGSTFVTRNGEVWVQNAGGLIGTEGVGYRFVDGVVYLGNLDNNNVWQMNYAGGYTGNMFTILSAELTGTVTGGNLVATYSVAGATNIPGATMTVFSARKMTGQKTNP